MNTSPNPQYAPALGILPADTFKYPHGHGYSCACKGLGVISREWAEKRAWKCDCDANTEDLSRTFHAVTCDATPCPFGDL